MRMKFIFGEEYYLSYLKRITFVARFVVINSYNKLLIVITRILKTIM